MKLFIAYLNNFLIVFPAAFPVTLRPMRFPILPFRTASTSFQIRNTLYIVDFNPIISLLKVNLYSYYTLASMDSQYTPVKIMHASDYTSPSTIEKTLILA